MNTEDEPAVAGATGMGGSGVFEAPPPADPRARLMQEAAEGNASAIDELNNLKLKELFR